MPTVRKSAIVPSSRERMFDLVEQCEHYPDFLPWCRAAEILERTPQVTRARLHLDYKGLKTRIETRNVKHPPESLTLEFVEGPFEHFHAQWIFVPLGEHGCKVEFALDYVFSNKAFEKLLGPMFGYIAETLVQGFVARAESAARDSP